MTLDVLTRALGDLERPAPTLPAAPQEAPPSDDAPARRGLRRAPPDIRDRPYLTIAEGRAVIERAITDYLSDPMPSQMLLIAAPAGIGKTALGVRAAETAAAGGQKVMYVGPRKEFFGDLMTLAARPQWWYAWQSRHDGGGIGLDATCRWSGQIDTWQRRGYAAKSFCSNPRICGWNYMHTACKYYAQEQRAKDIIFAQYEHVAMGHLLMQKMHLIIGDELPIRAFLHPWIVPAAAIVPPRSEPGPTHDLVQRLRTLASVPNVIWRGPELLDAIGGAAHIEQISRAYRHDISFAAYEPELRSAYDAEDAPYFHIPWLLQLLHREAERALAGKESISRVRVDPSGLTLLLRRAPGNLPPHVIWLDATANSALYETLFRRPVQVVQPDVALTGRVYQVWAGLNNKMGMSNDGLLDSAKIDHVRQQIARILSRAYTCPAFISYKDLVRSLVPSAHAETDALAHFGGNRGTNRLQDCDCLIVVGAPQPPTPQLLDMAAMLYHERDEPFDSAWSTLDRPFEGQPWAWPIGGFWNDAALQTLLDQARESELTQAIHRARPLIRDVDVWLLTNVPLQGLPVELVSLRDLFGAPEGVDVYRWPEVTHLAAQRMDAAGMVTTADLVDAKVCKPAAARRYLDALSVLHGWDVVIAPAVGRGKPPLACVKRKQDLNIDHSPISNL